MLSATLNNFGLHFNLNEFINKYGIVVYNELLQSLTMRTERKLGPPLIAKLYKHIKIGGIIYLCTPRGLLNEYIANNIFDKIYIKFNKINNNKITNETNFNGKYDDNQILVIDHLITKVYNNENLKSGTSTATLIMKAGYGKTIIGMGIYEKLKVRTLIIVPNEALSTQWRETIQKFYLNTTVCNYNSKKPIDFFKAYDITIIIINSAYVYSYSILREFSNIFSFVIMDEIHMYSSKQRQRVFWKFQSPYMLGLTATADDRIDKFDKVHRSQVNHIVDANKIIGFKKNIVIFNGEVEVVEYYGPSEYTKFITHEKTGMMDNYLSMKQLEDDPNRTQIIIDHIIQLNNENYSIFIFCEHKRYINILSEKLNSIGINNGIVTGSLKNKAEKEKRKKILNTENIILTTYSYSGTGLSVNRMTAMILASPRKSGFKQILPRIMRIKGDPSILRKYIDIFDMNTGYRGQYKSREQMYNFYNIEIKKSY